jgi:hypothetical protein
LWRYFFSITLQKKREKGKQDRHWSIGCVGIHLRNNWVDEYMSLRLVTSNKG